MLSEHFRHIKNRMKVPGKKRTFYPYVLTLEPSYACNLSCKMCPRGEHVSADAVMAESVFSRIEPYLPWFKFVHLCGFGEPLMHPDVEQMTKRIYDKGCLVSFVTNGILLSRERIKRFLEQDTKIKEIAISIDASHKEMYESIRGKGNFEHLIENLRELQRQLKTAEYKPQITWAFLLMKSNLDELPHAVELADELGFDRIVGKHIETGKSVEDLSEALFDTGYLPPPDEKTERHFQEIVEKAREMAVQRGVRLEVHPRRLIIDNTCGSQPLRALYIDYKGNVSPCCYLNVLNVMPYLNRQPDEDNGVMGNIVETPLEKIIDSPRFKEFCSYWADNRVPPVCRGCLLARRMELED